MGNSNGFGQNKPVHLAEWRRAAEDLAQQTRLAWVIGRALSEALAAIEGGGPAWDAQQWWGLLAQAWASVESAVVPPPAPAPRRSQRDTHPVQVVAPVRTAATLELDGELSERWHVVLYLGSVRARGEWVTLAIGVDLSGTKHVLGLWDGATLNEAVVRRAVGDLTARGLRTEPGVPVVTDGRRASSTKLLPALQPEYAGAAARLWTSREAVLTVARLGLPAVLAPHLAVAGVLGVAVEHALDASPPAHRGVAAVRAGLPAAVSRMRRLMGAAGLTVLAQRLSGTAEAAHNKTGVVPP
ncbi:MAG: hypothetical protein IMX02_10725 [Limnochordaceae bacterium]|nr:hypothetical protein [Limnochordaceae bacterium]